MIEFFIGFIVGCGLAAVGFVWANRNKPSALDAAEAKVRDWKKP